MDKDFMERVENWAVYNGEITVEADKDGIIRYKNVPEYSEEEIKNFNVQDMKFALTNLEKKKVDKVLNTNGLLEYVTKVGNIVYFYQHCLYITR
ncbi:unnamed protein product [Brugia pahangi]|uniref:Myosin motor domain-containing protein n=1 Tax=Brugia pahangi TaxID=6280 RepID=A0A0N4T7K1_BRUPA|nr:unnamed protein product [Brugia pahangi]